VPLSADVIFPDGDERSAAVFGAGWLWSPPELVQDAEFLLTEGGTSAPDANGRIEIRLGTTEKYPLANPRDGTSGHGSRPHRTIPSTVGASLVAASRPYQTPLVVTPTDSVLPRPVTIEADPARRPRWRTVRARVRIRRRLLLTGVSPYNALLVTPFRSPASGSDKTNVIPAGTRALESDSSGPGAAALPRRLVRSWGTRAWRSRRRVRAGGHRDPVDGLFRAIVARARERRPTRSSQPRPSPASRTVTISGVWHRELRPLAVPLTRPSRMASTATTSGESRRPDFRVHFVYRRGRAHAAK